MSEPSKKFDSLESHTTSDNHMQSNGSKDTVSNTSNQSGYYLLQRPWSYDASTSHYASSVSPEHQQSTGVASAVQAYHPLQRWQAETTQQQAWNNVHSVAAGRPADKAHQGRVGSQNPYNASMNVEAESE
ncbi:hypothetical protein MMC06_006123 [Schaereria dolodes]|nr:hypothetical protein [Schaereria dolodes]